MSAKEIAEVLNVGIVTAYNDFKEMGHIPGRSNDQTESQLMNTIRENENGYMEVWADMVRDASPDELRQWRKIVAK